MNETLKLGLKLSPFAVIGAASLGLLVDFGINGSEWAGSKDGSKVLEAIAGFFGLTVASWGTAIVLRSNE